MEQQPYDQDETNAVDTDETFDLSPALIGWGIAAIALAIFMVTSNNSALVLGAGTFAKIFAVIAGSVLGTVGAIAGDALRRAVMPSMVFTSGGFFSLMWIKVFWKIGPQVIGLVGGVALGATLVLR